MTLCYITINQIYLIGVAVILTLVAIIISLRSYARQMRSKLLSLAFMLLTGVSVFLFPCWAYVIGVIEVFTAIYIGKDALKIVMM